MLVEPRSLHRPLKPAEAKQRSAGSGKTKRENKVIDDKMDSALKVAMLFNRGKSQEKHTTVIECCKAFALHDLKLNVSYCLNGNVNSYLLKIPASVSRFMVGVTLNQQQFFARYFVSNQLA